MPFTTYANQKSVCIHKLAVRSNFLQIANSDWMEANKTLTPYGLQLYLYLASNADGFNLELSPQHAENAAGIRRTTFYEYLRKLEINGYLVWRRSNHYDFYTTPRPAEERTHPDHHKDYIALESNPPCESTDSCEFAAETVSSQDDKACPSSNQPCSTGDIVTDNRYAPENKTYNNIPGATGLLCGLLRKLPGQQVIKMGPEPIMVPAFLYPSGVKNIDEMVL